MQLAKKTFRNFSDSTSLLNIEKVRQGHYLYHLEGKANTVVITPLPSACYCTFMSRSLPPLLLLLLHLTKGSNSPLINLISIRWNQVLDCARIPWLDAQRGPLRCLFTCSLTNLFPSRDCGSNSCSWPPACSMQRAVYSRNPA